MQAWNQFRSSIIALMLMLFAIGFVPECAEAQMVQEDVVYLKSGSILRGTIVEQRPGESISIRTRDGNLFIYKMSDVDRMTKEQALSASTVSVKPAGFKDPGTATIFSVLVPGGGQLWVGDTKRGAIILGAAFGAPILGIAASNCNVRSGCNFAPYALGAAVAVGAWVYGIIDADQSAIKMNAARGLSSLPVEHLKLGLEKGSFQLGFALPAP